MKLVVLEFNSFQFDSSCIVMLFMPQFHINKLMSLISRTFEFFSCFTRINLSFFIFSIFLVLVQIRIIYCMLHIASYHRYPLVKIHLYQGYFNMSHHWHMNMCCLIKLHENILTLFKGLSTNEQMSIQKVKMEKWLLHFTCGNNHDGVVSILCMMCNLLFTSFFPSYIINCIKLCDFL